MNHLKYFENFKFNNITMDDVIKCIKNNGFIYTDIVKDLPNFDKKIAISPLSIDDDGLITATIDGQEYEIDLENVIKIDI